MMREVRTHRSPKIELRSSENGPGVLTGYAAVFNRYSQNLGGYVEEIDPSAFTRTLASAPDVLCLRDHNLQNLLGRTVPSGTLVLSVDEDGLRYEVDLPDTEEGRTVAVLAQRRDITGSSFGFRAMPNGEAWGYTNEGFPLRRLTEVRLFDVGPTPSPAYLDTEDVDGGLALRSLADATENPIERVLELAGSNELRSLFTDTGALIVPSQSRVSTDQYRRHLVLAEAEADGNR